MPIVPRTCQAMQLPAERESPKDSQDCKAWRQVGCVENRALLLAGCEMNCLDCGVIIDTNHKRCEPCRDAIKRAKNKVDAQRQRARRHARGLVTTHAKGGKENRVNAKCMRCGGDVVAAANRLKSTLCQACRDKSNSLKAAVLWRKHHPAPIKLSGATCVMCGSGFVNGLCECKE
jgi:hypothetical protein